MCVECMFVEFGCNVSQDVCFVLYYTVQIQNQFCSIDSLIVSMVLKWLV